MFWSTIWTSVSWSEFSSSTADTNNLTCLILNHVGQETLNMFVWAMDIDVKHSQMIFERIIFEFTSHGYTSILYDNIEFFTFLLKLIDEIFSDFLNLLIVSHVKFDSSNFFRISTCFFNSLKFINVSSRDYNISTMFVELISKELSNTWWGSRNPDSFSLVVWFGKFTSDDFVDWVDDKCPDQYVEHYD